MPKRTPEEREAAEREALYRDFEACSKLSLEERVRRGSLHTFKPVLDEGPGFRSWDTMEDYRRWCEANLPDWLGYRRVTDEEWERLKAEAMKG